MNASGTRLTGITRDLWSHWQDTKACWRDSNAQAFEEKYLAELFASVDKTAGVIEQLDKLLQKIRKDCE